MGGRDQNNKARKWQRGLEEEWIDQGKSKRLGGGGGGGGKAGGGVVVMATCIAHTVHHNSKADPGQEPCGFMYAWWDCSLVLPFWRMVWKETEEMTSLTLLLHSGSFFLLEFSFFCICKYRILLASLLTTDTILFARYWKIKQFQC